MNGNSLFLDTNIVLYFLAGDETLTTLLDKRQITVSFITELELLSFKNLSDIERTIIQSFLSDCVIMDINAEIKKSVIELRSKYSIKLPDAIVAATANYFNQPLITADSDFKKLEELDIIFYEK